MPIQRGEDWGREGILTPNAPIVASDHELAAMAYDHARSGRNSTLQVGLTGGDLCRTLGGRGDIGERRDAPTMLLPIDVWTAVGDDGVPHPFVAHVTARGVAWSGPTLVAMNADMLGPWRPAPKAHPGDGLLDIVLGSLGLSDRLMARRRAQSGDHLPHPGLRVVRATEHGWQPGPLRRITVDNVVVGRHRSLELRRLGVSIEVAV